MTTDTMPIAAATRARSKGEGRTGGKGEGRVEARLDTHEAVCALRYDDIVLRLSRLEKFVLWLGGVLIAGETTLIARILWAAPSPH